MSEKGIALVITIGLLLAIALWVPFLELLRKVLTGRERSQ